MYFTLKLLVVICLVEISSALGPSLEDLANKQCPTLRPVLCLPYGLCCSFSEFCYAGLCESCFFDEVKPDLLGWCRNHGQYNVSLMRSHGCRLACQDLFTSLELAVVNETIIYKEQEVPTGKVQNFTENKQDYFGILVAVMVLLLGLILIVTLTKMWKCLPLLIKPKLSKLPKSDTIATDIESLSNNSLTRNGSHSKKCEETNSTTDLTQANALENDTGGRKKDTHEGKMVPQLKSDTKCTNSKVALISSKISATASESSQRRAQEMNLTKKKVREEYQLASVLVHQTDTANTSPMGNSVEKNNYAHSASCRPKKEDCMIALCQDNEIGDDDSSSVPFLGRANKEEPLFVTLPPSASFHVRKNGHVLYNSYSATSSSSEEPEAIIIPQADKDSVHIHSDESMSNNQLQSEGGSQRSDEDLGAAACVQDKAPILCGSTVGIYSDLDVDINDKKGAKASMTENILPQS